jgi:hypothetical protein
VSPAHSMDGDQGDPGSDIVIGLEATSKSAASHVTRMKEAPAREAVAACRRAGESGLTRRDNHQAWSR